MSNVVLVHIGNFVPEYIYDNIYQLYLINKNNFKIYLILNESQEENFWKNYKLLDIKNNKPIIITVEALKLSEKTKESIEKLKNYDIKFRDNFWCNTIIRLLYVCSVGLESYFHIENDVMMYVSFNELRSTLKESLYMVRDNPKRVIGSIMYFGGIDCREKLKKFITEKIINATYFENDMNILGKYEDFKELNIYPKNGELVYDGAAIGQYLGGVDARNVINVKKLNLKEILKIYLKTRGFINETCVFKCNEGDLEFTRKSIVEENLNEKKDVFVVVNKRESKIISRIVNLHIHSKQLYMFSSKLNIEINDIITGDRISSLSDAIILDKNTLNYHKGLNNYTKEIIVIGDWRNINTEKLRKYLNDSSKKGNIKLGLYTHHLYNFVNYVLPKLPKNICYELYIHNSDHAFDHDSEITKSLLENILIKRIHAQNLNINHYKCSLLPIGIANSMFKHGNILELYEVMSRMYKYKKTKEIYINMNTRTFDYRRIILEKLRNDPRRKYDIIDEPKAYKEYLEELGQHKYCLCIRGNGLDTHRFWEALYLGVKPIVINNEHTNTNIFVKNLHKLNVDFIEIFDISELNGVLEQDNAIIKDNSYLKLKNYES